MRRADLSAATYVTRLTQAATHQSAAISQESTELWKFGRPGLDPARKVPLFPRQRRHWQWPGAFMASGREFRIESREASQLECVPQERIIFGSSRCCLSNSETS